MTQNTEVFHMLHKLRLIPVIAIDAMEHAQPLAESLVMAGLPCAEVTFRTPAAADAIELIAARGDVLVGAGTVSTVDQVKLAVDRGARFIVSPGFNPQVVGYCVEQGIPVAPGVCTPTDIEMGLGFGLNVLKFFPAEAFGGLATLQAISGPYGALRFIPTGGINTKNLKSYLESRQVLACGGSWMVKRDLIASGQFGEITRLTREAVALTKQIDSPPT